MPLLFVQKLDKLDEKAVTETSQIARCPSCGSRDIRRSQASGIFDSIMANFHRLPYRCRPCGRRFYRFDDRAREAEPATAAQPTPTDTGHIT